MMNPIGFSPLSFELRSYPFAGPSAMATIAAAMPAAAAASVSWASPSTPSEKPDSSPIAWAASASAAARSQARPSDRGRPNRARTPAGTPTATRPSTTTAGGTLTYERDGAAKSGTTARTAPGSPLVRLPHATTRQMMPATASNAEYANAGISGRREDAEDPGPRVV